MSQSPFSTPRVNVNKRNSSPPHVFQDRKKRKSDGLPSCDLNLTFIQASSVFSENPNNPNKTPCVRPRNSSPPPLFRNKNPNERRGNLEGTILFPNILIKNESEN